MANQPVSPEPRAQNATIFDIELDEKTTRRTISDIAVAKAAIVAREPEQANSELRRTLPLHGGAGSDVAKQRSLLEASRIVDLARAASAHSAAASNSDQGAASAHSAAASNPDRGVAIDPFGQTAFVGSRAPRQGRRTLQDYDEMRPMHDSNVERRSTTDVEPMSLRISTGVIPRDSINPLRVETIVTPVRPPAVAPVPVESGRERSATPIPGDPVKSLRRETIVLSVAAPPQPKPEMRRTRGRLIPTFRIGMAVLGVIALGAIGLNLALVRHAPARSIASSNARSPVPGKAVAASGTSAEPKDVTGGAVVPDAKSRQFAVDGKTLERRAVDAIARGSYAEAADLYEGMARSKDDVFGTAARIARRKSRRDL